MQSHLCLSILLVFQPFLSVCHRSSHMMTRFCRFLKASRLQIADFFSRSLQPRVVSPFPPEIKRTQHNVRDSTVCCCRCAYGGARVVFVCVRARCSSGACRSVSAVRYTRLERLL